MPVSAETLRLLLDAGLEGDDLLRVVESIDRTPTKERSANAERQARHRAKKKGESVTSNVTNNVTGGVTEAVPLARVEGNLKTKNSTKQNKQEAKRNDLAAFKAELHDIDAERLDAIVKHRTSKNGQLTGHAAKLFRRDAEACGMSMPEAVDTCISRNWITVKPEYFKGRSSQQSTAPPKKITHANMWTADAIAMGIIDDPSKPKTRHLEPGLPRGQNQGTGLARRIASA